jgi:tRNA pseudouridine38-40 synthase
MTPDRSQRKSEAPGARAFKLTVEYDGTRYAGWQRQSNALTVQQALEEALQQLLRHPVRCPGAGRTDAGVHALGQVARVVTALRTIDAQGIRRGANAFLPDDVRVVSAQPCALGFDPRRDARLRWYRYSVFNRSTASALDRHRLWHVPQPLDWPAVERALPFFQGRHDFRAFRVAACSAKRTVLNLVKAECAAPPEGAPHVRHFDFECRSFLHSQIRLMVGLLVEIGLGRHPPEAVRDMLESGRQTAQFRMAPPNGLVLMRVDYPSAGSRAEKER